MHALFVDANGSRLDEPEERHLNEGEARVKIKAVGLCREDLDTMDDERPTSQNPSIIGRGIVGKVTSYKGCPQTWDDDALVSVCPYISCQKCHYCRTGRATGCPDYKVLGIALDGAPATEIIVPAENIIDASDLLPDQALLLNVFAIGAHAIHRAEENLLTTSETALRALVLGCGPTGLAIALQLVDAGHHLVTVDKDERRCTFARSHCGIAPLMRDGAELTPDDLKVYSEPDASGERPGLFDIIFDTTGDPRSPANAYANLLDFGGTLLVVGQMNGSTLIELDAGGRSNKSFIHIQEASGEHFETAADFAEIWPVMITHQAPFDTPSTEIWKWADDQTGMMAGMIVFED